MTASAAGRSWLHGLWNSVIHKHQRHDSGIRDASVRLQASLYLLNMAVENRDSKGSLARARARETEAIARSALRRVRGEE